MVGTTNIGNYNYWVLNNELPSKLPRVVMLDLYSGGGSPVRVSSGSQTIPIEVFRGFSQSLHTNDRIVP
jgi:hypothetical protein